MFNLDLNEDTKKCLSTVLESLRVTRETLSSNNKILISLRDDLFQKKRLIATKKKSLSIIEDQLKNTIAEENDPHTKKPRYSNEVRRQAEFLERSANDVQIRGFETQIDDLMKISSDFENKIESLIFTQDILKLDYSLGLSLVNFLSRSPA